VPGSTESLASAFEGPAPVDPTAGLHVHTGRRLRSRILYREPWITQAIEIMHFTGSRSRARDRNSCGLHGKGMMCAGLRTAFPNPSARATLPGPDWAAPPPAGTTLPRLASEIQLKGAGPRRRGGEIRLTHKARTPVNADTAPPY